MKKFILLIMALVVTVAAMSQLATRVIPQNGSYADIPTAYNITNTTAGYFLINTFQVRSLTTRDYIVQLDSVSGTHTNVAVVLAGRKFPNSAWATLATVNWKGTTKDTTILINDTVVAGYREYKVTYTGTGTGVTRVKNQEFKLWGQ